MIYPEKIKSLIQKDTCTSIFIATLFTIAKTCKQPKWCSLTDEWIKKMCGVYVLHIYIYTHNGIYSAIKKWNNTICSNMDGPRDYRTKWSKSDDKYHMISLTCRI